LDVLKSKPSAITKEYLAQFAEFREFQARQSVKSDNGEVEESHDKTPDETLDAAYQVLRRTLAQDLLDRIKNSSPRFFEAVVIDLLLAMGYGGSRIDAGEIVGKSGDGGIDGLIKEDKLGLDVIYVQAKRWLENTVERRTVQEFAGSLAGQKARKGVFITTSRFSHGALQFVERLDMKIILIDGEQLAQLMIDYGVGVSEKVAYSIKRIDEDYFTEE
jgi:restriction system protein